MGSFINDVTESAHFWTSPQRILVKGFSTIVTKIYSSYPYRPWRHSCTTPNSKFDLCYDFQFHMNGIFFIIVCFLSYWLACDGQLSPKPNHFEVICDCVCVCVCACMCLRECVNVRVRVLVYVYVFERVCEICECARGVKSQQHFKTSFTIV